MRAAWGTCLIVVLTLAPAVFATLFASAWHYDHPFVDEWAFVPMLVRAHDGALTWSDLWVQFHEHRAVFLKLIMFGLARLSHWNLFWEVGVSLVATAGTLAIITRQLLRLSAQTGARALGWALPACSLLLFSPSQWENWFFGLFMHNTLSVFFATLVFAMLCKKTLSPLALAASIALAVVATYTFIAGIFIWIAGAIVVLLRHRRWWVLASWFAAGLLCLYGFFYGWAGDPRQGTATLGALVIPFLAVLGSPVLNPYGPAAIFGVFSCAGLAAVLVWFWRRGWLDAAAPLFGAALYSVIASASIAWGRVSQWPLDFTSVLGLWRQHFWDQDSRSRYITYANPVWALLIIGLVLAAVSARSRPGRATGRLLLAVLVGFMIVNAARGWQQGRAEHERVAPGREALLSPDLEHVESERLLLIDSVPERAREYGKILKARNWTLFRR